MLTQLNHDVSFTAVCVHLKERNPLAYSFVLDLGIQTHPGGENNLKLPCMVNCKTFDLLCAGLINAMLQMFIVIAIKYNGTLKCKPSLHHELDC